MCETDILRIYFSFHPPAELYHFDLLKTCILVTQTSRATAHVMHAGSRILMTPMEIFYWSLDNVGRLTMLTGGTIDFTAMVE